MSGDRPLRILLFSTAPRWMGEAATTDLLARTLAARGHEVAVAVPERGSNVREVSEALGCPVAPIPWRLQEGRGSTTLAQMRAVARLLRERKPHIIHVGRGKEHWSASLMRPWSSPSSRIVRTRHVVLPMRRNAANRWLFRHGVDGVTAISSAAMEGLGDLGADLPASRRRVVLGAVESSRYHAGRRSGDLRRRLGADEGTLLVGLLGRWHAVKGHDVFHRAMGRVMARHPEVRAVVAGRKVSPDLPQVRRLAEETGFAGRFHYLDSIPNPEELIASLDVGVIASLGSEAFSRIAVEYMASGVPFAATRVGGIPEIVEDGETGLLTWPGDPASLEAAVERLVLDADLRRRLAANALPTALGRFSPERFAAETEEVYRACLGG